MVGVFEQALCFQQEAKWERVCAKGERLTKIYQTLKKRVSFHKLRKLMQIDSTHSPSVGFPSLGGLHKAKTEENGRMRESLESGCRPIPTLGHCCPSSWASNFPKDSVQRTFSPARPSTNLPGVFFFAHDPKKSNPTSHPLI